MHHPNDARWTRPLRKAAAILASAVVAGAFLTPSGASLAAGPGTGRILGRLTSASGVPVSGDIIAIDESTGKAYRTTAARNGAYAITDVPAGRYAVLFRPSEAPVPEAPFGYVDAWFPNERRGDDAGRVIVDMGTETAAVDSSLSAAGRVTGILAGAPGTYAVALLDEPTPVDPFDGDTLVAEIDGTGCFSLRAPAGGYELLVYRRLGHEWLPYALAGSPVAVESRSDVAVPSFAVPEPGRIELTLRRDPDDDSADDGSAEDGDALAAGADVTLAREGAARIERDGLTDAAGRVVFECLAPGTYTVVVNGEERNPPLVVTVQPDSPVIVTERRGPVPA